MTTPVFEAGALQFGPGRLFEAPLGTTLPTDHSTPLGEGFNPIGYTEEGSELSFEMPSEPVEVAESLDPIMHRPTARNGSLTFAMAQITVRNLTRAFNGGTVTAYGTGDTAGFSYEPPEPGQEVRRILVWESEDGQERWVYPQVFQGGSVSVARRKGAAKATLPVEFRLEKPVNGGAPFKTYYAAARSGGVTASAP